MKFFGRIEQLPEKQHTSYSLVYGMEAITPLELIEPSLRVTTYSDVHNSDTINVELELITEKRERARVRMSEYQRRVKCAFDKHVAPREFQINDLVLKKVEATGKHVGKLEPNWEGPFRVSAVRGQGAYELEDMQGMKLPRPWNVCHLRKFFT